MYNYVYVYMCRHTIVTRVYKIAIGFQRGGPLSKKGYNRCMLHTYLNNSNYY